MISQEDEGTQDIRCCMAPWWGKNSRYAGYGLCRTPKYTHISSKRSSSTRSSTTITNMSREGLTIRLKYIGNTHMWRWYQPRQKRLKHSLNPQRSYSIIIKPSTATTTEQDEGSTSISIRSSTTITNMSREGPTIALKHIGKHTCEDDINKDRKGSTTP